MTYTVRIRTLPGALMTCEYLCPFHERIERTVERNANGDPPEYVRCGEPGCIEPNCDGTCRCWANAELVISAASVKFWSRDPVAINSPSSSDKPDPRALDTRPLAEGKMSRKEWRKWQAGITAERRYQKRLASGRISRKIQVGGG